MIDVLALDIDAAVAVLRAAGHGVEIVETRTAKPVALSGPRRVIRQRETAEGVVVLVVTHERFGPRPEAEGG